MNAGYCVFKVRIPKIELRSLSQEKASIDMSDAIFQMADEAFAAIVITKKENDYGLQDSAGLKKILRVPAFAFLYLLGNAEKQGYKGTLSV